MTDFKCELFKALEKEKRVADVRFLAQNQLCPMIEEHYYTDKVPEYFKRKKLHGHYLGFTISQYTYNDKVLYSGYSFANYLVADGTPLVMFSVGVIPTVRGATVPVWNISQSASIILGIGCVAAIFLAARSVVKRESKKAYTPYFSSLSDLMNYIYRMEVEANKHVSCPTGLGRVKSEISEMFSWI